MVLEAPILTAPEVRIVLVQAVRVASRTLGLVPRRAEAMAPGVPVDARSQPSRSKSLLLPTLSVHLTVFRGLTRLEEANTYTATALDFRAPASGPRGPDHGG